MAGRPKDELSKAGRIRCLLYQGFTNSEIAEAIDCLPEYVRAVRQRIAGTGSKSVADQNYILKRYGTMKAYHDISNEKTKGYRRVWNRNRNRSVQRRTA